MRALLATIFGHKSQVVCTNRCVACPAIELLLRPFIDGVLFFQETRLTNTFTSPLANFFPSSWLSRHLRLNFGDPSQISLIRSDLECHAKHVCDPASKRQRKRFPLIVDRPSRDVHRLQPTFRYPPTYQSHFQRNDWNRLASRPHTRPMDREAMVEGGRRLSGETDYSSNAHGRS